MMKRLTTIKQQVPIVLGGWVGRLLCTVLSKVENTYYRAVVLKGAAVHTIYIQCIFELEWSGWLMLCTVELEYAILC